MSFIGILAGEKTLNLFLHYQILCDYFISNYDLFGPLICRFKVFNILDSR